MQLHIPAAAPMLFLFPYSQHSNLLNQARLTVLKARDDHVKTIVEETKGRLGYITRDSAKYKKMLEDLIAQVCCLARM